eukprot:97421-Rhodomonas_salina.1
MPAGQLGKPPQLAALQLSPPESEASRKTLWFCTCSLDVHGIDSCDPYLSCCFPPQDWAQKSAGLAKAIRPIMLRCARTGSLTLSFCYPGLLLRLASRRMALDDAYEQQRGVTASSQRAAEFLGGPGSEVPETLALSVEHEKGGPGDPGAAERILTTDSLTMIDNIDRAEEVLRLQALDQTLLFLPPTPSSSRWWKN